MIGGFSNSRLCCSRMQRSHSSLLGFCSLPVQPSSSRLLALPVFCSNSASNGKPVRRKVKTGKATATVASIPSVPAGATVAAAAAVTAVSVAEETPAAAAAAAPPASDITLKNPPLGFSNNIVPARPLVVTQPDAAPLVESPLVDSSDEDLDDSSAGRERAAGPVGGGTGRSSAWRCLVLDSRYLPVNVVPWGRAVVMDLSGKVDVLEYHPGGFAFSAYKQHPLPAVLRVRTFVDVHEFAGRLSLTRKNIMLRDHNRCQYCGSSRELTLDHVTPVCRGGVNSWQNLVTACMSCNQRKGDKSLQQLGWSLPSVPREPTPQEVGVVAGISKSDLDHPPRPWEPYLASFKYALEKAQKRATAARVAISSNSSNELGSFLADQQRLVSSSSSSSGKYSPAVAASVPAPAASVKAAAKKSAAAKRMS